MEAIYQPILIVLISINVVTILTSWIMSLLRSSLRPDEPFLIIVFILNVLFTSILFLYSIYSEHYEYQAVLYTTRGANINYVTLLWAISFLPLALQFYRFIAIQNPQKFSDILLWGVIVWSLFAFVLSARNFLHGKISPPFETLPFARKIFFAYDAFVYPMALILLSNLAIKTNTVATIARLAFIASLAVVAVVGPKLGFKLLYADYYPAAEALLVSTLTSDIGLFALFVIAILAKSANYGSSGEPATLATIGIAILFAAPFVPLIYSVAKTPDEIFGMLVAPILIAVLERLFRRPRRWPPPQDTH